MSEIDKESEQPVVENVVTNELPDSGEDLVKFFKDAKDAKDTAVTTEVVAEKVEEPAKELSDIEKQAVEMGWRPAAKFDTSTEGKRFIGAEEFVERGQLFKKIDHQKSELHELKNVLKDMSDHYKKTEELAYNRALNDLLTARDRAVEEGNIEDFKRIDSQVAEVSKQAQELQKLPAIAAPQAEPEPLSREAESFYTRNQHWFNNNSLENSRMVNFAASADKIMMQSRPDLSEKQRIELIEADIQLAFPHRFENANRSAPPTVAMASAESRSTKGSDLVGKLSHRQQALAKAMIAQGLYTSAEEYAKDLDARGALR